MTGPIAAPRKKWHFSTALLLALLLLAGGCVSRPGHVNLILITIDTLRADHLGCYGYFRDTSPAIDNLAGESILFERCIVPLATTLPSHTSLLTSTYPIEHGVIANVKRGGYKFTPSPKLQSYAEIARAAGYNTAAFVSAAPLNEVTGIAAGFDHYDQPVNLERIAAATNDRALEWLDNREKGPFFLWIHYYDPHFPYTPPVPYKDQYQADEALDTYMTDRRFARNIGLPSGDKLPISNMVNKYDGEIRYLDDQLSILFAKLKKEKLWNNTALVFTSDHGEGVGQHGRTGHSFTWEEQVHAPLLMHLPGTERRRIPQLMSQVDIFPTLLALVPELPRADFFAQASGRNVVQDDFLPSPVLSQDCEIQRHDPEPANYTLTTTRWKLMHEPEGIDHLYDLTEDPYELVNVAAEHPDILADLKHQLFLILAEQQTKGEEYRAERGDTLQKFDPKMREQLRGLGYLN